MSPLFIISILSRTGKCSISVLSSLQVCSNEATCICDFTWAGTDCSIRDPVRNLHPSKDEGPKGLCDFGFISQHAEFIGTLLMVPIEQLNGFERRHIRLSL